MMKLTADPETMPSVPKGPGEAIKPELNKIFKPAFLGRMVIIPYYPVRDEASAHDCSRSNSAKSSAASWRITSIHLDLRRHALIQEVANRCTEVESGARNVDNILTNTLLPDISRHLLTCKKETLSPSGQARSSSCSLPPAPSHSLSSSPPDQCRTRC
jgi:type VI secretion system protein VasG